MGKPVRILDLAHNMIELAGLKPGEDIEVRITGLRPGEKMYEEIALDGEDMLQTDHPKIRKLKGLSTDADLVTSWLNQLQLLIARRDGRMIVSHLMTLVPEYKPGGPEETTKVPADRHAIAAAGNLEGSSVSRGSR